MLPIIWDFNFLNICAAQSLHVAMFYVYNISLDLCTYHRIYCLCTVNSFQPVGSRPLAVIGREVLHALDSEWLHLTYTERNNPEKSSIYTFLCLREDFMRTLLDFTCMLLLVTVQDVGSAVWVVEKNGNPVNLMHFPIECFLIGSLIWNSPNSY